MAPPAPPSCPPNYVSVGCEPSAYKVDCDLNAAHTACFHSAPLVVILVSIVYLYFVANLPFTFLLPLSSYIHPISLIRAQKTFRCSVGQPTTLSSVLSTEYLQFASGITIYRCIWLYFFLPTFAFVLAGWSDTLSNLSFCCFHLSAQYIQQILDL